jgi:hypothetical protein
MLPAENNKTEASRAFFPEITFEGIGLLLVLFIIESVTLSVYWFIAAEPEERKKTPAATRKKGTSTLFPERKYPVTADNVTAADSLYFVRSAYDRNVLTILFPFIEGF